MGMLKNLTGTPEGIVLIVMLLIAFSTLISYLIIGAAIFGILAVVFWQTLLPGIMMLFGVILFLIGASKLNAKVMWAGAGLLGAGLLLAAYLGA